jgi:hypothetical protein
MYTVSWKRKRKRMADAWAKQAWHEEIGKKKEDRRG